MTAESLLQRRFRVLGQHSPLFYDKPLQTRSWRGSVGCMTPLEKRYLDAYNNVPHVGHCHPRVVEALCKQARMLNSHTRYLDETVVNYAERLLATFDASLNRVFFTCTGSESNDAGDADRTGVYGQHGRSLHRVRLSWQHGCSCADQLCVHAAIEAGPVRSECPGDRPVQRAQRP